MVNKTKGKLIKDIKKLQIILEKKFQRKPCKIIPKGKYQNKQRLALELLIKFFKKNRFILIKVVIKNLFCHNLIN